MPEKPPKPKDVDAYIAGASEGARPILIELRAVFTSTLPDAQEGISWGVPFYKYKGQIGGFSAFKNHVSVGLSADVLTEAVTASLEADGYHTGKATFQIGFDQKVPAATLKQMLEARAKLNVEKKR